MRSVFNETKNRTTKCTKPYARRFRPFDIAERYIMGLERFRVSQIWRWHNLNNSASLIFPSLCPHYEINKLVFLLSALVEMVFKLAKVHRRLFLKTCSRHCFSQKRIHLDIFKCVWNYVDRFGVVRRDLTLSIQFLKVRKTNHCKVDIFCPSARVTSKFLGHI